MKVTTVIALLVALVLVPLRSGAARPARRNATQDEGSQQPPLKHARAGGGRIRLMDGDECTSRTCSGDANCECCCDDILDRNTASGMGDAPGFGPPANPECGSCTLPQGTPGCSVPEIEAFVCNIDTFCCEVEWDAMCVDNVLYYDVSCFLEEGEECAMNCARSHSGVGCDIPAIEECVCSYDPFCCENVWDSVCVEEMWQAPCHVDCDCSENERAFRGGDSLPPYWKNLGDSRLIDTSALGFNVASGKWCYAHSNTCIQWGERGDDCDDTEFVCAGHMSSPTAIGYGSEQIDAVADMLSSGGRQHYMCPDCHNTTACESGAIPGTDNAVTATFTDCQCEEHHSGYPLVDSGYWWGVASNAGLEPSLVTQRSGKWYYNGLYTCVGMGQYADACDDNAMVCAGDATHGAGAAQMSLVSEANSNGGVHSSCPSYA